MDFAQGHEADVDCVRLVLRRDEEEDEPVDQLLIEGRVAHVQEDAEEHGKGNDLEFSYEMFQHILWTNSILL